MAQIQDPDEFELLERASSDSFDLDEYDPADPLTGSRLHHKPRLFHWLPSLRVPFLGRSPRRHAARTFQPSRNTFSRRGFIRRICFVLAAFCVIIIALLVLTAVFRPSYTNPPPHYQQLRELALTTGRANPHNEKVYIAANIIDAELIQGPWGEAVLELIDLLGDENVFLSIYENDSGAATTAALRNLEMRVKCNSSVVSEHLPLEDVPHIHLPSGDQRIKRMAYLAEVRNRALRPLDFGASDFLADRSFNSLVKASTQFDKILFINDVIFSPIDAANLLFSTGPSASSGKTTYRAACATDFKNPFKFYDTFATRDLEGYRPGVPFYPFFTTAGEGQSRKDVLAGRDAVRVRSCWGGMVAFDAQYFQRSSLSPPPSTSPASSAGQDTTSPHLTYRSTSDLPLRFRSDPSPSWESSECCLIHADIIGVSSADPSPSIDPNTDVGIYMNPFIRVAYDTSTYHWLGVIRRIERLFSIPHNIANHVAGLPFHNPRRTEQQGELVYDKVWSSSEYGGPTEMVQRRGDWGGYCAIPILQVLRTERKPGEKMWEQFPVPPNR